jgi:transcriptional regulator with XRE-family HTH domain
LFVQLRQVENEEKIFVINFGNRLKKIRLQKNLSQEMLANDADIPINQIGRIERAEISTSLTTIFKIAKALDVPVITFFDFDIKE